MKYHKNKRMCRPEEGKGVATPLRIIPLVFEDRHGRTPRDVHISGTVIAGWTGRDVVAVEKHIVELEKLGIRRPATTPIFYRVSAARLSIDNTIEALGQTSSGEVEYILLQCSGRLWVGVGSDHTDREVEAYGITVSKQLCDKPIARTFWPFDEVAPHWSALVLRSHLLENGKTVCYQEGTVNSMLEPTNLIERYTNSAGFTDGTLMFCGTLEAIGGIRPSRRFAFELEDPVLGRIIRHYYDVHNLPVLG